MIVTEQFFTERARGANGSVKEPGEAAASGGGFGFHPKP